MYSRVLSDFLNLDWSSLSSDDALDDEEEAEEENDDDGGATDEAAALEDEAGGMFDANEMLCRICRLFCFVGEREF